MSEKTDYTDVELANMSIEQLQSLSQSESTPTAEATEAPAETAVNQISAEQTEPAQAAPATETSQSDLIKEIFGDRFKSIEELKSIAPELSKRFDEYETITNKLKEQESLVSEFENPFANDTLARYNEAVKKNPDISFSLFKSIDGVTKDTPKMDILKAQYILDNPNFEGKEAIVEKMLNKKYGINPTGSEYESDEDKYAREENNEIASMHMDSDVKKALESIDKFKTELSPVKFSDASATKRQSAEALKASWEPIATQISASTKSIPFKNSKGETLLEVSFPVEYQKSLSESLLHIASAQNIPLTDEGLSKLQSFIEPIVMASPSFMATALEEYGKKVRTETEARYTNPSALQHQHRGGGSISDGSDPITQLDNAHNSIPRAGRQL